MRRVCPQGTARSEHVRGHSSSMGWEASWGPGPPWRGPHLGLLKDHTPCREGPSWPPMRAGLPFQTLPWDRHVWGGGVPASAPTPAMLVEPALGHTTDSVCQGKRLCPRGPGPVHGPEHQLEGMPTKERPSVLRRKGHLGYWGGGHHRHGSLVGKLSF